MPSLSQKLVIFEGIPRNYSLVCWHYGWTDFISVKDRLVRSLQTVVIFSAEPVQPTRHSLVTSFTDDHFFPSESFLSSLLLFNYWENKTVFPERASWPAPG